MGQTVFPRNVPQMVLRVLVTCPPLGVDLATVDALYQALQKVSVVRAGNFRPDVYIRGPGWLGDRMDEGPRHVVPQTRVAGPQVRDVELSNIKLLIRDEHNNRNGAVPSDRALHQPFEPFHGGLCGESNSGDAGEL